MKAILCMLGALCALCGFADASVSRILVRQQWPWSSKVRVDYELSGVSEPVDVQVTAVAGGKAVDAAALDALIVGDRFGLKTGRYSFEFEPETLFSGAKVDDFRVTLTPVKSDLSMADALYKIVDLGSGQVEDVSVGRLLSGRYGSVIRPEEAVAAGGAVTTESYVWTGVTNDVKYATDYLVLRKIYGKGKTWTTGAGTTASPSFSVSVNANYYAAVFETTQGQWKKLMGSYPNSYFNGEGVRDRRPVEYLSYSDIRGGKLYPEDPGESCFLGVLTKKCGLKCDLPGEYQWEWAAMSGVGTPNGYNTGVAAMIVGGKDDNFPGRYTHNGGKIGGTETPSRTCGPENGTAYVGSYAVSKWGLYDCLGNVAEVCLDFYQSQVDKMTYNGAINVSLEDPTKCLDGTSNDGNHIARAGHWRDNACFVLQGASHPATGVYNNYGFRVFVNIAE